MAGKRDDMTAEQVALSPDDWDEAETRGGFFAPVASASPRVDPRLRQVTGEGSPREFVIDKERLIIGRSNAADIVVDAPELSRQHVALERDGDGYRCTDLDSLHGLYLNGLKVHECRLRSGDTVQLGSVAFVFTSEE